MEAVYTLNTAVIHRIQEAASTHKYNYDPQIWINLMKRTDETLQRCSPSCKWCIIVEIRVKQEKGGNHGDNR